MCTQTYFFFHTFCDGNADSTIFTLTYKAFYIIFLKRNSNIRHLGKKVVKNIYTLGGKTLILIASREYKSSFFSTFLCELCLHMFRAER